MSAWDNLTNWLSWHYWADDGGKLLWAGVCEQMDSLADLTRQALSARYTSQAPTDALQEIAYNRNLQPPASLVNTALRTYLRNAWNVWAYAATRGVASSDPSGQWGLLNELYLLGCTSATITRYNDLADAGHPDAFGGDASCWFLHINQPSPFTNGPHWGDGVTNWGDGTLWGVGDPAGVMRQIKALLAKWSPPGSRCCYVEVVTPDGRIVVAPNIWWWELLPNGTFNSYYNFTWTAK